MKSVIFENCNLLDVENSQIIKGMNVLIEQNIISQISDSKIKSQNAIIIDSKGKTLMPGLIDAHVHITATSLDLGSLSKYPHSLNVLKSAKLAEAMLMRGFTSVRDCTGADWGFHEAIDKDLIRGPRLFFVGKALGPTGGHGDRRPKTYEGDHCTCYQGTIKETWTVDGVAEVQKAARRELRKGAHAIKIFASGGVASPDDPIFGLQFSEDEIRAVVNEANSWKKYVLAHAYTSEAITRAIKCGVRTIEHGNLMDRKTAKFMNDKNAYLVPNLITYEAMDLEGEKYGLPKVSLEKNKFVKDEGKIAIDYAYSEGVKIGYGTDLLGELQVYQSREFLMRQNIMPKKDILKSATLINAEIVNQKDKIGVIKEGSFADILLIDGNPLEDFEVLQNQGEKLLVIMKDGKFYKNNLS
jgi:imidazolonepropionase-like amidohydrolase